MSTHETIIDINPVDSGRQKTSRNAASKVTGSSKAESFSAPSYGRQATYSSTGTTTTGAHNVVNATIIDGPSAATAKKPSLIAGAAQTVVGGAIMLVGVPMLILPGPGLLALGGGAVVAVGGIKKLLGK